MLKTGVKYGVIGGAMMVIIFLIYYFLDKNPLFEMFSVSWFTLLIFLFFAIKEFRDSDNHLLLAYWQGMSVGFSVYFTYSCVLSLFMVIFISWIDTGLVDEYIQIKTDDLLTNSAEITEEMGGGTYEKLLSESKNTEPFDIVLDLWIKFLALGLFFTAAISVIMKRKQKTES